MKVKVRTTIEAAVKPKLGLGTLLAALGRSVGGANIEIRRDPTPVKPAKFA